ncbi:MAG: hypothetical protein GX240_00425 [Candidatus Atribacteria bacterium]|nr:hypothetical protein [Candidatus Atribacteria bacterium]
MMVIKDLFEINRRLSYDLWNVTCRNEKPTGLSPRLIFPVKRIQHEIRISEQEARILYCNILNNLNYFYSIETPTDKRYKHTGNTEVSALSDLSIYKNTCDKKNHQNYYFDKLANIEFKAHNPAEKNIEKDIEKLVKEGIDGNWVHILKNINSATLPVLFQKFINSIKECSKKFDKISILFGITVLDKKFSIIKHLGWNNSGIGIDQYLKDFFVMPQLQGQSIDQQKVLLVNNQWDFLKCK